VTKALPFIGAGLNTVIPGASMITDALTPIGQAITDMIPASKGKNKNKKKKRPQNAKQTFRGNLVR
jgi:hypothetical protein